MTYKGIIFDFNGTLFWDSDKHSKAWRRMAEKLRPHRELTDEEMDRKIQGRINPSILEYLAEKPLDVETIEQLSLEKEEIYRRLCREDAINIRLAPGAVNLLGYLVQNRIPHTIATSSERTNVDFYIETFNLARWFELDRIVYDDGTIPGKPAPDIYLRAAERIGLQPQECIVVEDALSGLRSARQAGIGRIIAVGPPEKRGELEQIPEADKVISDFDELDRALLSS